MWRPPGAAARILRSSRKKSRADTHPNCRPQPRVTGTTPRAGGGEGDLEVGGEDGGGAGGGVEDGGARVGLFELEDPGALGQVALQLRQALRLSSPERCGGRARVAEVGQGWNR